MENNIIKKEKFIIYMPYQMNVRELIRGDLIVEIETRKNKEKVILVDYPEDKIKEEKI